MEIPRKTTEDIKLRDILIRLRGGDRTSRPIDDRIVGRIGRRKCMPDNIM